MAPPFSWAMAISRCSVETYSSLSRSRLLPRALDHALEALGGVLLPGAAAHRGELLDRGLHLARERLGARAQLGEQRAHHALLLLQQGQQQVLGLDGLMAALVGQRLRGLDGFLGLDGQLVQPHLSWSPV